MDKKEKKSNKLFGLLGRNISYSFSRGYFSDKFKKENLNTCEYTNFDIPEIQDFPSIIEENKKNISGINVTIPYKETVIPFLDEMDNEAQEIGAVNTIKILENNKTKGFNTDVYGFENSLKPLLKNHHTKALILGTGGASKAVAYAFKKLNIKYLFVSRNPKNNSQISYNQITEKLLSEYNILVNCSPVGTFPDVEKSPEIPYQFLSEKHLLFDLIYNPEKTAFLSEGEKKGAIIKNGYEMLELQAEESWRIWSS